MLVHQVQRDKLKSHIQALELERAALLSAVSRLQKLVPEESLQQANLSPPADPPSSHSTQVSPDRASTSHVGLSPFTSAGPDRTSTSHIGLSPFTPSGPDSEPVSADLKDLNCPASTNRTLPSVAAGELVSSYPPTSVLVPDSRTEDVATDPAVVASKDTQLENISKDSATSEPTTDTASVSSSCKTRVVLPLPTLNFGVSETRLCMKALDDLHVSEVTPNPAQLPTADVTLSFSSTPSSLSSSLTGDEEKNIDDHNIRKETTAKQNLTETDVQHSAATTVSSIRSLYPSRSISNVPSDQPAVGSVTPEERRKSVKVVVQHSTTTRNIQQSPSSQR